MPLDHDDPQPIVERKAEGRGALQRRRRQWGFRRSRSSRVFGPLGGSERGLVVPEACNQARLGGAARQGQQSRQHRAFHGILFSRLSMIP